MELESKEKAKGKKEKAKGQKESSLIYSSNDNSMACHICLTRDHFSYICPYKLIYPAGATVGRFAEIICLCCGKEKPHPGLPGIDWEARADLKPSYSYPSIEEELMELNMASTSESAVDGTGKVLCHS